MLRAVLAMPKTRNATTAPTDTFDKTSAAVAVALKPMMEAPAWTAAPPQQAIGARALPIALVPPGSEIDTT